MDMDGYPGKENITHKGHLEEKNKMDDELTPTNEEIESLTNNMFAQEKIYRICVSPIENSGTSSSEDTTPDAVLLNNSPFAVKLVPKLLTKRKASHISPKTDSSDDGDFKTPEKPDRPINFSNLSPRSVTYEFSSKYTSSGLLRPKKVSRSCNSLIDSSVHPCCSKSLEQGRAKSDEPIEGTHHGRSGRSPPRKKKHVRSVSFSDKANVFGGIVLDHNIADEVDKLAVSIEPMKISPENDFAKVVNYFKENVPVEVAFPDKSAPNDSINDNINSDNVRLKNRQSC